MRKQYLQKIKSLEVTQNMQITAQQDIPKPRMDRYDKTTVFEFGRYLKAIVSEGILKVSVFYGEHLRFGGVKPIYDLFFDKKSLDFITYDYFYEKWSSAKLDRLEWTNYAQMLKIYLEDQDRKCIQEYFNTSEEPYSAMLCFQENVREQQLLQRHKKQMEVWNKKMKQVPGLPKDWGRWVNKVGITYNFIFYKYKRGGAETGYCTWCEKMVPIKKVKHNMKGKCSCCGHEIQYKCEGRMPEVLETEDVVYLLQRIKEGIVVKEFQIQKRFFKKCYIKPIVLCNERRRVIYDKELRGTEYYYGMYKKRLECWIKGPLRTMGSCGYAEYLPFYRGKVYGKTIPSLSKRELRQTGFAEVWKSLKYICPSEYFSFWKSYPFVEQLIKAGLKRIVNELVNKDTMIQFKKTKELGRSLGIDRFRLGRLRDKNGGLIYLEWLRHEKCVNKVIPDFAITWFEQQSILPTDIQFILERMSELQVQNYLIRQQRESKEQIKDLLSTWKDYLTMAKRLHMDVQDAIVYRAKSLLKRHNEIINRVEDEDMVLQAGEIETNFPFVDQVCESLKGKYDFSDKDYQIVVPEKIEDILSEAKYLNHCVDRTETYFDRINSQETYLLFLRKKAEIDKPFYTLEIEPDGTIRQARTFFNRQREDIELAKHFLFKWQKQLKRKLNNADYELAQKSRKLRKAELEDLRTKKVKINGGDYQGRLLADVLEEGLMENQAEEELAA